MSAVWRDVDWERKRLGGSVQHLKRTILTAFAGITAALGIWADAADLFVPIATSPELNGAVSGGTKERLVRIARSELANLRTLVTRTGTGRLLLNVDAKLELGVVVERTAPTRWGYSLSGRIDSPTLGFVTLVVHDEAVAGAIWTPDVSYEIVHLDRGLHAVREVGREVPQCKEAVGASGAQRIVWPENTPAGDQNAVVDVLVVWTPRREEMAGGVDAVRAEIELHIAHTNDAFNRSGAFVALNLVGAELVPDYDPVGDATALRRLANPSDGHMDAVHGWRDALGADLVSLATHRFSGRAQIGGAFSVSGPDPNLVAHEFGHNFGLSHERSELPSHYQHGYVISSALGCRRTIMALGVYGDQCDRRRWFDWIPFFSSPVLSHPVDGVPLGMSRFSDRRGADGPADAALHLNRVRNEIENFKPRRPPTKSD